MSKVKICGIRRLEDIDAVNLVLPDYIGFVFAPSRRRIDARQAALLKDRLDSRIQAVGVFVNQDAEFITELYRRGIIQLVQLHGDEDAEYILRLRQSCGGAIIRSVSVSDTPPHLPPGGDYYLFDTASSRRGGSGQTFDWNLIDHIKGVPFFLAGGLTPENAGQAICRLSPYCLDVSGGVEINGVKSLEKIREFVNAVRRQSNGKR